MGKRPKTHEIRGDWKMLWVGRVVGFLLKLLGLTLRYRAHDPNGIMALLNDESRPVIFSRALRMPRRLKRSR